MFVSIAHYCYYDLNAVQKKIWIELWVNKFMYSTQKTV